MSYWHKVTCDVSSRKKNAKPGDTVRYGKRVKERKKIRMYTGKNGRFLEACERAGIKPTRRQYNKWTRKMGAARAAYSTLIREKMFGVDTP